MISKQTKKQQPGLKGFSIGETLLSITILTVGILATMQLLVGNMRDAQLSRDIVIASGLVQEGIELVRNVRDNDFADGGDGFTFARTGFMAGWSHCRIQYDDTRVTCLPVRASDNQYELGFDGNGFYRHNGGTDTKFKRYIYINQQTPAAGPYADVISFVYWGTFTPPSDGTVGNCTLVNRCIFSRDRLTSWK